MEAEFDTAFEVIFNYDYDCCAFAHNICGSKPRIPDGMLGTSQPLSPEFFINPQFPPDAILGEVVVAPEADINEEVERSIATEINVGDNPDSLSKVAGKMEELGASSES